MISPLQQTLFAILMAMVAVWFPTVIWMFRRLRTRHAEVYEAMGSPSLFLNNNIRSGGKFLKFLFSSESQRLDDSAVAAVAWFMRVFLLVYGALFAGLLVAFFMHA